MDAVQAIQEGEYDFPYHYIPESSDGAVRQFQYWGWGYKYLAGIEMLQRIISEQPFERLIDVGCGDGRLLRQLATTFGESRLMGIDYSERAIGLAKVLNPRIDYRVHDILQKPLGETFDVVTLSEVLEHIPPDAVDPFVEGLAGLMHSGSRLIVTVPHANQKLNPKHYQHFTSESLGAVLSPHVKVVGWRFFDRRSRRMALWNRVLRNKLFVLNHAPTLRHIWSLYTERYLEATETDCLRLAAICEPLA